MGSRNLGVSELTLDSKGKKGEAYLAAVYKEAASDHKVGEGSKEDNAVSADAAFYNKKK